jgi:exonuclease SbcC
MKPYSLRIKGIKNYLTEQFIDFESLSSEGIFGICGNSGSGKSAIIDSIIIALYGDLPENSNYDKYDIVNLTDKSAEIDFVFSLNTSYEGKKLYQIIRKLQPLKTNRIDAEIFDITDQKISLASGQRDVNNYVSSLLKLDVNDFSKCVVLIQGEYDKFVSQKDAERKKMIGNIFSLKKYGDELNSKVLLYRRELEKQQDIINSVLDSLGHIDQKTIDSKKKELRNFKDTQKQVGEKIHILQKEYNQIEKGYNDYQEYLKLKTDIKKAQELIPVLKQNIIKLDIDYKAAAENAQKQKELTDQKEQLKSYIDSLNKNINTQQKIIKLEENRSQKANEYKKLKNEYKSHCEDLEKVKAEMQNQEILLKKILNELYQKTGIALEQDDSLNVKVIQEYNNFSQKVDKYIDLSKQLKETKQVIDQKQLEYNALIPVQAESIKTFQQCESDLNLVKQQYQHVLRHNAASLLKSEVKIGEHCPVCDNIISKLQKDSQDIQNIDDLKKRMDFLEKGFYDISQSVASNAQKILSLEKELNENKQKADNIQIELNKLNLDNGCISQRDEFCTIKDEILDLTGKYTKSTNQQKDFNSKIEIIKISLSKVEEEGKVITEQINELKNELKQILGEYDSIDNALNQSNAAYRKIDTEIKNIIEAERKAERELNDAKNNLEKTQIVLDGYMREISKLSSKEVTNIQVQSKKEELTIQNQNAEEISRQIGALEGEVQRLENDLIKYKQKTKELKEIKKRLDLIIELHKLTQGNKLMEFMAEEYIEEFTYTASEYLSMLTMGQFELEYRNGFFIKDYLNSGQYRNVNTVSGGEKFLVSLSLAISISRALSRRAGAAAVEFLFIDEGFGTLDSDLIDTVMDTLDKLKGDFVIGLISHRQELQQRLPKKLIISKKDNNIEVLQS